jgi:hypothetical protein
LPKKKKTQKVDGAIDVNTGRCRKEEKNVMRGGVANECVGVQWDIQERSEIRGSEDRKKGISDRRG